MIIELKVRDLESQMKYWKKKATTFHLALLSLRTMLLSGDYSQYELAAIVDDVLNPAPQEDYQI